MSECFEKLQRPSTWTHLWDDLNGGKWKMSNRTHCHTIHSSTLILNLPVVLQSSRNITIKTRQAKITQFNK
jgi:hypothetical protein